MTAKISSSEVSEDILLADDDEEQARVAENEEDDVKSVMTNLSKSSHFSSQIVAGSMQAMEVLLKRLHSPASDSEIQTKKRREHVVDVSDGEDKGLPPSREPTNADWADGDQSARVKPDNSNDSLLSDIAQDFSKQEDTGPPISQKLAEISKKVVRKTGRTQVT